MSEATEPPENRRLGDFEIVREIGRGGMGIVYEARQVSLNRKVALKVLAGSLGLTSKAVVRFRREAEAAAKLHHTNIVPIYATGEEKGTHFYHSRRTRRRHEQWSRPERSHDIGKRHRSWPV